MFKILAAVSWPGRNELWIILA